jgi:hypothetical protein
VGGVTITAVYPSRSVIRCDGSIALLPFSHRNTLGLHSIATVQPSFSLRSETQSLSRGVAGLLSRSAPHAILASTRDIHKYIHSVLTLLALARALAMVLMPCWLNRVRD